MLNLKQLTEAILTLAGAVRRLCEQKDNNKEILQRIGEMETRMAIKVSQLDTTVSGLQKQVEKIWTEQQTKYDKLVTDFTALKQQLDNAEIPAEAETALTEFAAKLQAFDDLIPDTTQ